MARQSLPVPFPFHLGLLLGDQKEGGLTRAVNVDIVNEGKEAKRRNPTSTITEDINIDSESGFKGIFEFEKNDGTKYVILDVDYDNTAGGGAAEIDPPIAAPTCAASASAGSMTVSTLSSVSLLNQVDTGLNDIKVECYKAAVSYRVQIDGLEAGSSGYLGQSFEGLSDTFKWSKDGGATWEDEKVPILPGGGQLRLGDQIVPTIYLSGGTPATELRLGFESHVGHTVGDYWDVAGNASFISLGMCSVDYTAVTSSMLDDLSTSGDYTGTTEKVFFIEIDTEGTPDKFSWSNDGGATWEATGVSITGAAQLLEEGVSITFGATTGHTKGAQWSFIATSGIYAIAYSYLRKDANGNVLQESAISTTDEVTLYGSSTAIDCDVTASANVNVTGIRIYRSAFGNKDQLYFLKDESNATATILLDEADSSLFSFAYANENTETTQGRILVATNSSTGTEISIVTWSDLAIGLYTDTNAFPFYAIAINRCYRVNGENENLVIKDNSTIYPNGVAEPAAAPTLSSAGGGDLFAGSFKIFYTYVRNDSGYIVESYPSPQAVVELTGNAINVTHVASNDATVTNIRFYRNLLGDMSVFYMAEEISNVSGTTKLIDSDDTITTSSQEYILALNERPPKSKYIVWAGGKMWYFNLVDEVNGEKTFTRSLSGKPEEIGPDEEDYVDGPIMGATSLKNEVVIFEKWKTWSVALYTPHPKSILSKKYGCYDAKSIQSTGELNSIIWVSYEGVIVYDGGVFKNISHSSIRYGDINRVGTLIDEFIRNAGIFYASYNQQRKQYNLVMLYRSSGSIQDYRHLIYSIQTDTWAEYKYEDSSGNDLYVVGFGTLTDGNGREVVVSAMIGDGIVSGYSDLIQHDVEPEAYNWSITEILDSTGASGTTCTRAIKSVVDANDNTYIASSINGSVFKVTPAGAKSCLATNADIKTALVVGTSLTLTKMVYDSTNSYLYLWASASGEWPTFFIVKIDLSGNISEIKKIVTSGADETNDRNFDYTDIAVDSVGSVYYSRRKLDSDRLAQIKKITDPGEIAQAETLYYEESSNDIWHRMIVDSDDNLYYTTKSGSNYTLAKLTDVTGAAAQSELFTAAYAITEKAIVSSTSIFFTDADTVAPSGTGNLYRATYAASAWTIELVSSYIDDYEFLDNETSFDDTGAIFPDGNGNLLATDANTVYRVWPDLSQATTVITASGDGTNTLGWPTGFSYLSTGLVVVCGYTTDNAFKCLEGQYFDGLIDITRGTGESRNALTWDGIEIDMQSIVYNLETIHLVKLIGPKVWLDVESTNPVAGAITLSPGYTESDFIHTNNESSEPTYSKGVDYWYSKGAETWQSSGYFDSDIEAIRSQELHLGVRGTSFRWALKGGNWPNAPDGDLIIRSPRILIRKRGERGEG